MARIRTIKPSFFRSEDVAALPLRARLLWIGLWTQCDDQGRTKDNKQLIKDRRAGVTRLVGWRQPRAVPQPGRRSRGRSAWQPGRSPAFLSNPPADMDRPVASAHPQTQGMPEVSA